MAFSLRRFVKKRQKKISVQEVHNIWDMLTAKNHVIMMFQIYLNFIHDFDLKLIVEDYLTSLEKHTKTFREMMNSYGVRSGDNPPMGVHVDSGKSEIIGDELICQELLVFSQEHVEMLLRAIRTSSSDDKIRKTIIQMTFGVIKHLDRIIKYMKLKGWINHPPLYTSIPADTPEIIDTSEAFHLWDHLTFRYDNIKQTSLYYVLAHDGDLKLLLKQGLQNVLIRQASLLEKEFYYFGLPLPTRPAEDFNYNADTGLVDDDYIYRNILAGLQAAASLHAQAFKQCITNDRIRNVFKDLLISEINHIDKMIRFGKLKGWLFVPPRYNK